MTTAYCLLDRDAIVWIENPNKSKGRRMGRTLSNVTMLHAWWRAQELGEMAHGFNYEHDERKRSVSLQGF